MNLVNYVIRNLCNVPKYLLDDAYSEGYLALCKAAKNYRKSLGTNFSTYACVIIMRRICSFVKKYSRGNASCISLSSIDNDRSISKCFPIIEESDVRDFGSSDNLDRNIVDLLSDLDESKIEDRIVLSRILGKSFVEIADELGINYRKVVYMMYKWRKKNA